VAELGKYLYCIIPCQEERTFDQAAIGDGGGPVYAIAHRGLAAVVSDSPVQQYECTRRNMMAHERVLETVVEDFTLLPVRLGTVTDAASPRQDIQKLLDKRWREFQELLAELEGKVELGLKAFWRDEKALFAEIVTENPTIKRLRDALASKPPEATHYERLRLGEMVKEALERKREREAARILAPLRRIACRTSENDALGDRMIVNTAFLVGEGRGPEFDRAVSKLEEGLGSRVALKYVGPAPPYNFVDIVVNWQEIRE